MTSDQLLQFLFLGLQPRKPRSGKSPVGQSIIDHKSLAPGSCQLQPDQEVTDRLGDELVVGDRCFGCAGTTPHPPTLQRGVTEQDMFGTKRVGFETILTTDTTGGVFTVPLKGFNADCSYLTGIFQQFAMGFYGDRKCPNIHQRLFFSDVVTFK